MLGILHMLASMYASVVNEHNSALNPVRSLSGRCANNRAGPMNSDVMYLPVICHPCTYY